VQAVRDLDAAGIAIDDIGLRRPTLDDVFLALTGHTAEQPAADQAADQSPETLATPAALVVPTAPAAAAVAVATGATGTTTTTREP
jgi:hypothetical protein